MTVKKLGKDVVVWVNGQFLDIFWGRSGWKPHARFQRKRIGNKYHWSQIAGSAVPVNIQQHLGEC